HRVGERVKCSLRAPGAPHRHPNDRVALRQKAVGVGRDAVVRRVRAGSVALIVQQSRKRSGTVGPDDVVTQLGAVANGQVPVLLEGRTRGGRAGGTEGSGDARRYQADPCPRGQSSARLPPCPSPHDRATVATTAIPCAGYGGGRPRPKGGPLEL